MLKYAAQCSCQTQNAIHCLRDMCNFCPFRQTQNDICRWVCKGGLISENFTIWARIVKKKVPNHSSEHYSPKGKMLRIVSGEYYLGDLSQSKKKLSEIKPPLFGLGSRLASGGGPFPYS